MAKILIVDDNPDVLQVMQLIFTSRDFEVATTTKGEETTGLVNTFNPSLIFLDINLGSVDGRDISRQLKSAEETKHIPIILFSANVFKESMLHESLADDFVAKPFDVTDLLVKVNRLIGSTDNAESITA
ncbi:MAG TPA: response regulator [Chitinophagaceae bacterium]|nr:response regulator [Chitinophagaceae bacterium]